jgi:parallel beta-helix repeat protein
MLSLPKLRLPLALSAVLLLLAPAAPASAQSEPVRCDHVLAADGSGTVTTLGALDSALRPGQTACLRGQIRGNLWITADQVTLTSQPGQRATLHGQLVIDDDASHVTVSDLVLDSAGLNKPSPIVLGDDALFARNEVTNRRSPAICFILGQLGHDDNATAERTRIEANRIHDCGVSDNHRHGIYLEHADRTRIIGNWLYDNADRAIQLYPSAQNTLIAGNVIDGNGQGIIFSGNGSHTSSGNIVRHNVLTNPRLRALVESWYPSGTPKGTGNLVESNCLAGGSQLVDTSSGGFSTRDNLTVDPRFADRARKDFTLPAGSPCARLLEAGRAGVTLSATAFGAGVPRAAAPVAPAAPAASAPGPTAAARWAAPVRSPLAVTAQRHGRRVRVAVKLRRATAGRTAARVEVRYGGTWRTIGVAQVTAGRAGVVTGRAPRGGGTIQVRATVLRAGRAR